MKGEGGRAVMNRCLAELRLGGMKLVQKSPTYLLLFSNAKFMKAPSGGFCDDLAPSFLGIVVGRQGVCCPISWRHVFLPAVSQPRDLRFFLCLHLHPSSASAPPLFLRPWGCFPALRLLASLLIVVV